MRFPCPLRAVSFVVLFSACHRSSPRAIEPATDNARKEEVLVSALRWMPTYQAFHGLPVVLMGGAANGAYRDQWVDSIRLAKIIHHACTEATVAECPDSARAAYVAFNQPDVHADGSADVSLTIVILDPSTCNHGSTPYTEEAGRLHLPSMREDPKTYHWVPRDPAGHRC